MRVCHNHIYEVAASFGSDGFFYSIEKSKNLLSHGCLAELEANLIHTEWLVPLIKLTFLWVEGSKQVGEIVLCDADDKWRVNVNVKKNCNIWFLIIRRNIQVNMY